MWTENRFRKLPELGLWGARSAEYFGIQCRKGQGLLWRTQPTTSADASKAPLRKKIQTLNCPVIPDRRSSSMRASPAHQTKGPSMSSTTTVAASANARTRFRPAFCSCITPSEVLTTRRVRSARTQSRLACVPARAEKQIAIHTGSRAPVASFVRRQPRERHIVCHIDSRRRRAERSSFWLDGR